MIVTFYSYKGGVGRTMALSNVAVQLAQLHGYQVLVVDWDLEAPGLHFYFGLSDSDLRQRPGLLDILERAAGGDTDFNLEEYITPAPRVRTPKGGSLSLITCGKLDARYMSRVARFDWRRFYDEKNGRAFLTKLKSKLEERYSICLIDSRAGQSDTNVPPTSHLADLLIMLFTSNDQSIAGTEELCRRLQEVRETSQNRPRVPIILAPSRVFSRQPGFSKWAKDVASPAYHRLVERGTVLRRDQPRGLEHAVLEIDPSASIGEQLPVLDQRLAQSSLVVGYRNLVELILAQKHNEDLLWRPERVRNHGAFSDRVVSELREDLKTAASRGDEIGSALAGLRLARALKELSPGHAAEARSLATTSLTVFGTRQDRSLQALALHTLGQVAAGTQNFEEAQRYYREALSYIQEEDQSLPRAIILHDLGVSLVAMKRYDEAEKVLRSSLDLKARLGDVSGQAMSTHQLGNLELSRGNVEGSVELFHSARRLAERGDDWLGAAISSHQLGNVFAKSNDWDQALTWFKRALAIHDEQKDMRGSGISRRRIGDVYERMGRLDDAVAEYRLALNSAHIEGDLRNQQTLHRRLAQIMLQAKQHSEARTEATTALRLSESVGLKSEVIKNLLLLAEVESGAGSSKAVDRYLSEAAALASEIPHMRERVAQTRSRIASALQSDDGSSGEGSGPKS